MTLPDCFWSKTATDTGCVVWQGAQNSKGYGCFGVGGRPTLAHRLAWEDANGAIPDGMTIDHLCRVRACVNVEHMEIVSVAENSRRRPRVLTVGGVCRHGHAIATPRDLYVRPGKPVAECRACRRETSARQRSRACAADPSP